ncbi:MAG: glycosyltransferase [Planctomycetota bacterium]
MRVLMLGWEFPPFISGGLGTACFGLTKGLAGLGTDVTFVLPKAVGSDYHDHVRLLSPQSPRAAQGGRAPADVASSFTAAASAQTAIDAQQTGIAVDASPPDPTTTDPTSPEPPALPGVEFRAVPSRITSPYPQSPSHTGSGIGLVQSGTFTADANGTTQSTTPNGDTHAHTVEPIVEAASPGQEYSGDLFGETRRYADLCVDLAAGEDFDVIHAHDWLTFPAGAAVAKATGKPLIVHVHSTEFDRAGDNGHHQLFAIEREGLLAADRVIAVSHLTRRVLESRYGCPSHKITVIYNGIENGKPYTKLNAPDPAPIAKTDKVVLYLGRITMQKGPEYFIHAAKRVLEKMDNVKFVMAGAGDKVREVIELAARHGIGHKVLFTGFLRGDDVAKVFSMADVYVMPSVSEPFGIAPLEAISHDVPVIISKTSGVSEVLQHVLKVDFWDIDEMANKIVAVLKYPPLGVTLRQHADLESRRLTWGDAAEACRDVYTSLVN